VLLYSPWLSTGRRLIGTSGGQCGQLKHQYKAGDDRMEKLLLTVWEAAEVLSVSRSRVYELLYAEQLDSVKIGRSPRVALSVGAALGGRSVGGMNPRRPHGEGPTGSPGYVWTDEPPDPTTFTLMLLRAVADSHAGALNTTKAKTAAAAVDSVSATGNDPPTPWAARGSASPDDQPNQGRRTGSQG
jgi:excisionase family DNA binding protein